VEIIKIL